MTTQNEDINQIIASAVNARVEAAVTAALASPDTMGTFVQAALHEPISSDGYGREKTTLLRKLVQTTIAEKTKAVVREEIEAMSEDIRSEVRKAIRKSVGVITDTLVDGFVANASGRYPSIEVKFHGRD